MTYSPLKIKKQKEMERFILIRITEREKNYLIEKKHLRNRNGRISDLHIASKNKNSGGKTYYVPDYYAKYLDKMYNNK